MWNKYISNFSLKLGAEKIDAIDNNPACIESSKENIQINECDNINLIFDDKIDQKKLFMMLFLQT